MGSGHRTSKVGGELRGSQGEAFVPGHGQILPLKKKCAMRKINLDTGYAMRMISGMTATLIHTIGSNNGGNLMTKERAAKVAAEMKMDDPDWDYVVEDRGNWAVVICYDEDGNNLGSMAN
jgi:hypothetical protein